MDEQRAVFITTPTYDCKLGMKYVLSLLGTIGLLSKEKIMPLVHFRGGNSLVPSARNECVAAFMESNAQDLFFIDADMAWEPSDFMRLLQLEEPFVGAAGRIRSDMVRYCMEPLTKDGKIQIEPNTGLIEVSSVGMAFVRIKRCVIEQMFNAQPHLKYESRGVGEGQKPYLYALFDCEVRNNAYRSEDYVFCSRYRALGGKIKLDPTVCLDHVGSKTYSGALIEIAKGGDGCASSSV